MKNILFLLLGLTLMLGACKSNKPQNADGNAASEEVSGNADNALSDKVFRQWTHSYEDDSEGVTVFRPSSYDFPRSRGRNHYEIRKGGVFIHTRIGRTDIPTPVTGKWELKGENVIWVTFPGTEYNPFTLRILEVNDTWMKIDKKAKSEEKY